ncbi:MAG: hypothetical protein JWO56_704 [Acidobacteria bacterium]|nr:hypothetical protein [Acidobacteriota bacterium]
MPIEERSGTDAPDLPPEPEDEAADSAAPEESERNDVQHAYSPGTPSQAALYGRRRDDRDGPVMHHSRATDDGREHLHTRASDHQSRWRLEPGHVITLVTTLVSTLVIVLSTYYTLKTEVDLHSEALRRLESTVKSKESADSDLKVVLTKLEELDRRMSERLERIEANQQRESTPAPGWRP